MSHHSWLDEEARSITQCCHNYMDSDPDGNLICRSCKRIIHPARPSVEIPPGIFEEAMNILNKSALILLLVLLVGCDGDPPSPPVPNSIPRRQHSEEHADISGWTDPRGNTHEYIFYWAGAGNGGGSMTHYPDCKYCKEKNVTP